MSAKIFSPPTTIKVPELSFDNIKGYNDVCKKFKEELKAILFKQNKGEYVGEVIHFPVADGHAEYMVASMRPLQLVHLPLGDAWNFQYAHRLTAKDVKEKIDNNKAFEKIWCKTKEEQKK